ncbi:AAA family ATPase [Paenibacillus rigui]|uniref:ATPase n=1 Tax=Paenibacillus rigui TaxID=554312 RepID=A0A229UR16_9BACL|nr:AAA family ATPase [Paenibacillus rigui]OXM85625.1 hypothetical protein CF651_14665 [Paenibacillus rigui]
MPKLVFFLGPAGAGKTTLAKALAKKRRAAFIDMDTLLRPAAEVIMTISGLDPNDRDSPLYKTRCRDLGYRLSMDAALENVELGVDAYVVGPFTQEINNPHWVESELSSKGLSSKEIDVRVAYVFLPDPEQYRERIQQRTLASDAWKLDNWDQFKPSLLRRHIHWDLPASSILYFDNSKPYSEEQLDIIDRFIYSQ